MKSRRDFIKDNINEQNFMQYEVAELSEWLMEKVENGQHIIVPLKIDKVKIVDVETILYVLNPKNNLTNIHFATGEVVTSNVNLEFMQKHLEDNFGFRKLDTGLIVNMKMVQYYHSNLHRVYFTKEHSIPVNGAAIRGIIKTTFGKERDLRYLNKSECEVFEYYPMGKTLT
jgi:hypothetical protein